MPNTPAVTVTEEAKNKLLAEEGRRVEEALGNLGFLDAKADKDLFFAIAEIVCEVLDHEELSGFCEEIEAASGEANEEDRIAALLHAIETIPNREDYGGGGNGGVGMQDYVKEELFRALLRRRLGGDRKRDE